MARCPRTPSSSFIIVVVSERVSVFTVSPSIVYPATRAGPSIVQTRRVSLLGEIPNSESPGEAGEGEHPFFRRHWHVGPVS